MKRHKTTVYLQRERTVTTVNPGYIAFWQILAILFAAGTAANLLVGDWGDAIDGAALTFAFWIAADRSRDVNALMGGF